MGYILGLYGIMENQMETTIISWGNIRVVLTTIMGYIGVIY